MRQSLKYKLISFYTEFLTTCQKQNCCNFPVWEAGCKFQGEKQDLCLSSLKQHPRVSSGVGTRLGTFRSVGIVAT